MYSLDYCVDAREDIWRAFGYVACTCTACAHEIVVVDLLGRCRKVASGRKRTGGTREAVVVR